MTNMCNEDLFNLVILFCGIQNTTGRTKLTSPWDVPFIVSRVLGPGTYRLQTKDGDELPNPWNIEHLRKFYA